MMMTCSSWLAPTQRSTQELAAPARPVKLKSRRTAHAALPGKAQQRSQQYVIVLLYIRKHTVCSDLCALQCRRLASYSASAHRQVRYGPSFVPELVDQDELLLRRRQQVRKQILLVSLLLFLSRRPEPVLIWFLSPTPRRRTALAGTTRGPSGRRRACRRPGTR